MILLPTVCVALIDRRHPQVALQSYAFRSPTRERARSSIDKQPFKQCWDSCNGSVMLRS